MFHDLKRFTNAAVYLTVNISTLCWYGMWSDPTPLAASAALEA